MIEKHVNPNVRKAIAQVYDKEKICSIEPTSYDDMVVVRFEKDANIRVSSPKLERCGVDFGAFDMKDVCGYPKLTLFTSDVIHASNFEGINTVNGDLVDSGVTKTNWRVEK